LTIELSVLVCLRWLFTLQIWCLRLNNSATSKRNYFSDMRCSKVSQVYCRKI